MKFLHLNFLPRSADFALLLLRLWFAVPMAALHGWAKVTGFKTMSGSFPDPFGVGNSTSLTLAIFGELICSILIVLGAFTRFAAIFAIITMGVAFFVVHKHAMSGPASGELAYAYLGAYLVIFFAGAGKFSVDAKIGATV